VSSVQHYRKLSQESKRLTEEAEKMSVRRQSMCRGFDTYTETDWSIIYRMYCVWTNTSVHKMWFWSPTGKVHGVLITMDPGVSL